MEKYKNTLSGEEITRYDYDRLSYSEKIKYEKIEESPISIMTDGHLGVNLGGGLSYDLSDGKIGINVGGFSIPL